MTKRVSRKKPGGRPMTPGRALERVRRKVVNRIANLDLVCTMYSPTTDRFRILRACVSELEAIQVFIDDVLLMEVNGD